MNQEQSIDYKKFIYDVPDFPKPGIIFRDISPLLKLHFVDTIKGLSNLFSEDEWRSIDVVGGVESRGFILGAAMAYQHGKGFVKIRKKGKLPGAIVAREYKLEYGEAALEMQEGSGRMLIVDDVLATGNTLYAAADIAVRAGYQVMGMAILINLASLNEVSWNRITPRTLVEYA